MITALIVIGVGFLLIFLEFFLPGGILGAAGGLILAAGLILFGIHSPNVFLTVGVVVASVVLLIVMVRWTLKRMQRTRFYLGDDQTGYRASKWAEELVGKSGEALSDMRPAGHVRIGEKQYQAVSRMGYLTKGTEVEVIGGEGGHLVVKKKG